MSCTSKPTLPQNDDSWIFGNNEYAYIDIGIALPSNIPVEATDSSGDADFEDLKALSSRTARAIWTSTGSQVSPTSATAPAIIEIDGAGSVRLRDSSGDIDVDDVRGDVEVMRTAPATSTSRKSTVTSRCSRTARAAFVSKT